MEREIMEYDVVVVGGGPSGLATAIRFAQLNQKNGTEHSICLLEKGSEIGAHILSGNVFQPNALDELIPEWKDLNAPLYLASMGLIFFSIGGIFANLFSNSLIKLFTEKVMPHFKDDLDTEVKKVS